MDVRTRFRLQAREYDERTCIIVVEVAGRAVGLIVDKVKEVLDIPENQIVPPPQGASEGVGYVQGMGKVDDEVKILLDVDRLLHGEKMAFADAGRA